MSLPRNPTECGIFPKTSSKVIVLGFYGFQIYTFRRIIMRFRLRKGYKEGKNLRKLYGKTLLPKAFNRLAALSLQVTSPGAHREKSVHLFGR